MLLVRKATVTQKIKSFSCFVFNSRLTLLHNITQWNFSINLQLFIMSIKTSTLTYLNYNEVDSNTTKVLDCKYEVEFEILRYSVYLLCISSAKGMPFLIKIADPFHRRGILTLGGH